MKRNSTLQHLELILKLYRLDGEKVLSNRTDREVFGKLNPDGYRQVHVRHPDGDFYIQYHRLKFGLHHRSLPDVVDHEDTDQLNNSLGNLREATVAQNAQNANRPLRDLPRGVTEHPKLTKPFRALIRVGPEGHKHLGYFKTPEEASKVVEANLRALHGAFYRE